MSNKKTDDITVDCTATFSTTEWRLFVAGMLRRDPGPALYLRGQHIVCSAISARGENFDWHALRQRMGPLWAKNFANHDVLSIQFPDLLSALWRELETTEVGKRMNLWAHQHLSDGCSGYPTWVGESVGQSGRAVTTNY